MKSKGLIHHLMSIFTKLSSWELSQVGGASYKQWLFSGFHEKVMISLNTGEYVLPV